MKISQILWGLIILAGCGSSKLITSYVHWDTNDNKTLDRYEFVNGYSLSGFFNKWTKENGSLKYDELYEGVFSGLDADQDNKLSLVEFNSKIDFFYFGLFNETFDKWDINSNATIDKTEFLNAVRKTNLAPIWDTSEDQRISQRELAGGMFYLADADSNGMVEALEFNVWKINR
jgi:Ca2+-binding EF-hand superfamily protein